MRNKEGGVMSIKEMEEAGIDRPEAEEEIVEDAYGRRVKVVRQVPESGEGIYDPETGKVEHFHRGQEKLKIHA